jgi:hypothetical protein
LICSSVGSLLSSVYPIEKYNMFEFVISIFIG